MKLFGLIGRKLGHSFSAKYFNSKFEKEKINARYDLFEIPSIEGVSNIILSNKELTGLNVTIPYKRDIIPYCNQLTESAREIGAVNTVRIVRKGDNIELRGHNTDAPGFWEAIKPMITTQKKALVLGQGGASRAVIYALEKAGIQVVKVSRKASEGIISYEDLTEEIMADCRIIVNCTPLGMWPDIETCVNIPYEYITPQHVCFDLVYNPEVTEFMKRCAARGAKTSNGLQMLYNQANLAWQFWNEKI